MSTDVTKAPELLVGEPVQALAGEATQLAALIRRLRRVEGQVGGLIRMLESGRDCTQVVTQLAAASRALDRVGFLLIASELRKCATTDSAAAGDPGGAAAKAAAVERLFLTLA